MTGYFVVGMGSNLGSREALLRAAELLIGSDASLRVVARSALYRSDPVGPPQPDYLNAAVRVQTHLSPLAVLDRLLAIERQLGRVRDVRWGPRTIDLDLLAWSEGSFHDRRLRIPHANLCDRGFALAPLADVAPELGLGPSEASPAPPTRSWSTPHEGQGVLVPALDEADAWALSASAWHGVPSRVARIEPFSLSSPDLVPGVTQRAWVALSRWTATGVWGWRLIGDEPALRAGPAAFERTPEGARLGPPKLL